MPRNRILAPGAPERAARRAALALAWVSWVGALTIAAHAEAQIPGIDDWARAFVEETTPRWTGQRVPEPDPTPRPAPLDTVEDPLRLLAAHRGRGASLEATRQALAALGAARDLLSAEGWMTPPLDGELGGTGAFDLYLDGDATRPVSAYADGPIAGAYYDGVTAFAVVDAGLDPDALATCVARAYAEALLLSLDPAEAASFRRASATLMAYRVTGRFDCDDAIQRQQREAWRGWIAGAAGDGAGGAVALGLLSERADGGRGRFLRELWQITRQRTWEGRGLRGAPDLWMAIDRALSLTGSSLKEIAEEVSIARYFVGDAERRRGAAYTFARALPEGAKTTPRDEVPFASLPRYVHNGDDALEPYGSAYALVDVRGAPAGARLRVWLRGEFGVEWSLVAVRLGEDGREIGRMTAPARRDPRSYLLLEALEGTAKVLLVVTNLSSRLPDADIEDANERSFTLIVDD